MDELTLFELHNLIRKTCTGDEMSDVTMDELLEDESGCYFGRDHWVSTSVITKALQEAFTLGEEAARYRIGLRPLSELLEEEPNMMTKEKGS